MEFRLVAAESGRNNKAVRSSYRQGLNKSLKVELATREEPTSLDQLIALAIRIDNLLREPTHHLLLRSFLPGFVRIPSSLSISEHIPAIRAEPPDSTSFVSVSGSLSGGAHASGKDTAHPGGT